LSWGPHHVVTIQGVALRRRCVWASVSSDGVVVKWRCPTASREPNHTRSSAMNHRRRLIINFKLTLFERTTEDNIDLERSYLSCSDIRNALRFTELKENVKVLPQGSRPTFEPRENSSPDAYRAILSAQRVRIQHATDRYAASTSRKISSWSGIVSASIFPWQARPYIIGGGPTPGTVS
jgi:hypothetical protein